MLSKYTYFRQNTDIQTHTQTRNTCANTYPSTQSSHRHTKKHKTQTYMHQQAQTQACTHVQYKQQTHKNANKHEHSRNHVCAHKEGADGHTWVAWDAQGQYDTEGRGNCVCGDTGGHGGHIRTRMVTEGNSSKKATQQIGPRRHQKHHQQHSKK